MVLYQKGEYAAFVELYERHSAKVYGYLINHAPQEADDLLQGVFAKLHEHRSRYDKNFPFLPWLFSIARNMVIDSSRKKRPTPVEASDLERLAGVVDNSNQVRPDAELNAALASLPESQRTLISLRFQEGLSFDEISERTGMTSSAVRKRVSRTVQGIRNLLGVKK